MRISARAGSPHELSAAWSGMVLPPTENSVRAKLLTASPATQSSLGETRIQEVNIFRSVACFLLGVLLVAVTGNVPVNAGEPSCKGPDTRPLFRIERNKNANFVQYDVQLTSDGTLDPKEPVIAYWIRLAEDGRKKELTPFQRRWYYGFTTTYDAKSNRAIMEMAAKNLRAITICEVDGVYRGETRIDSQPAFLEKMFVTSVPCGVMRKVTSIELYGKDTKTGVERYERITP